MRGTFDETLSDRRDLDLLHEAAGLRQRRVDARLPRSSRDDERDVVPRRETYEQLRDRATPAVPPVESGWEWSGNEDAPPRLTRSFSQRRRSPIIRHGWSSGSLSTSLRGARVVTRAARNAAELRGLDLEDLELE